MLKNLKNIARRNLINIPGWRTNRKIVVFESDDWGSIRMPSKKVFNKLLSGGIRVDKSIYDTFDTLEQEKDLELLFNTLIEFRDIYGKPPVFTFNTVLGNPAFEKIKYENFNNYYYEDFFTSYSKYSGSNLKDLWFNAIDEKLIHPQFHAREHLNVSLWMEALQNNHKQTKIAFDHGFFGLKTEIPSTRQNNYLAAYWPKDEDDFKQKMGILEDGLELFEQIFGFESISFIACNYIYPIKMEGKLSNFGIRFIQNQYRHLSPAYSSHKGEIKSHFTGQKNIFNQYHLVRNCFFEPTIERNSDVVNQCMMQVEAAFRWRKPAIISTHRINYVGGLEMENRVYGIRKLEDLLTQILKRWPEVEFLSTEALSTILEKENENSYS